MIVLALAATILALGAPNFREFRRNARLTSTANDFVAAIQAGRTEAIKRQRPVAVCPTTNPSADAPECSDEATDFTAWLLFEDEDADCAGPTAATLLRAGGVAASGRGTTQDALAVAANGTCLLFAPNGFLRAVGGIDNASRVVLCDGRGLDLQVGTSQSAARGIEVAPTGRGQVTRDPAVLAAWGLECPAA
jgi:Tfp pilus assembly protein FimT